MSGKPGKDDLPGHHPHSNEPDSIFTLAGQTEPITELTFPFEATLGLGKDGWPALANGHSTSLKPANLSPDQTQQTGTDGSIGTWGGLVDAISDQTFPQSPSGSNRFSVAGGLDTSFQSTLSRGTSNGSNSTQLGTTESTQGIMSRNEHQRPQLTDAAERLQAAKLIEGDTPEEAIQLVKDMETDYQRLLEDPDLFEEIGEAEQALSQVRTPHFDIGESIGEDMLGPDFLDYYQAIAYRNGQILDLDSQTTLADGTVRVPIRSLPQSIQQIREAIHDKSKPTTTPTSAGEMQRVSSSRQKPRRRLAEETSQPTQSRQSEPLRRQRPADTTPNYDPGFDNTTATIAMILEPARHPAMEVLVKAFGDGDAVRALTHYAEIDHNIRGKREAITDNRFIETIEARLTGRSASEDWEMEIPIALLKDEFNIPEAELADAMQAIGHTMGRSVDLVDQTDEAFVFSISQLGLKPIDDLLKGARALHALQHSNEQRLPVAELGEAISVSPEQLPSFLEEIRGRSQYFHIADQTVHLRRPSDKTEPAPKALTGVEERDGIPYGYRSDGGDQWVEDPVQQENIRVIQAQLERLERISKVRLTTNIETRAHYIEILFQGLSRGDDNLRKAVPTRGAIWHSNEVEAVLNRIIEDRTATHLEHHPPLTFGNVSYQFALDGTSRITIPGDPERTLVLEVPERVGRTAAIILGAVNNRHNQANVNDILLEHRSLQQGTFDDALSALRENGIGEEQLGRVGNILFWHPETVTVTGDAITELAKSGDVHLIKHLDQHKLVRGHRLIDINEKEADVIKLLIDAGDTWTLNESLYRAAGVTNPTRLSQFIFDLRRKAGLRGYIVSNGSRGYPITAYRFVDPQNPPILKQAKNTDGEVFLTVSIDGTGLYATKWEDPANRVQLTPQLFDLLEPLMDAPEQKVARREILQKTWFGEMKPSKDGDRMEFSDYQLHDNFRRLRELDPELAAMIVSDIDSSVRLIDTRKPPTVLSAQGVDVKFDSKKYYWTKDNEEIEIEGGWIPILSHLMALRGRPASIQKLAQVSDIQEGAAFSILSNLRTFADLREYIVNDVDGYRFIDPEDPPLIASSPNIDIFVDAEGHFIRIKGLEQYDPEEKVYLDKLPKLKSPTQFAQLLKTWGARPYYPYNGHELMMDAGIGKTEPIPWGTTLEEAGIDTSKPTSTITSYYQHLLDLDLNDIFTRKGNTLTYMPDPATQPIAWANDAILFERPDGSYLASHSSLGRTPIEGDEAKILNALKSEKGTPNQVDKIAEALEVPIDQVDGLVVGLRSKGLDSFIFSTDEGHFLMEPANLVVAAQNKGVTLYRHHGKWGYIQTSEPKAVHLATNELKLLRRIIESEGRVSKEYLRKRAAFKTIQQVNTSLNRFPEKGLANLFVDHGDEVEFLGLSDA